MAMSVLMLSYAVPFFQTEEDRDFYLYELARWLKQRFITENKPLMNNYVIGASNSTERVRRRRRRRSLPDIIACSTPRPGHEQMTEVPNDINDEQLELRLGHLEEVRALRLSRDYGVDLRPQPQEDRREYWRSVGSDLREIADTWSERYREMNPGVAVRREGWRNFFLRALTLLLMTFYRSITQRFLPAPPS